MNQMEKTFREDADLRRAHYHRLWGVATHIVNSEDELQELLVTPLPITQDTYTSSDDKTRIDDDRVETFVV